MEFLAFLGSLVGGVLNWMGVDRRATAMEEVARSRERQTRSLVDGAVATWAEWRRAIEAQAAATQDAAFWHEHTQRTRIYYNAQAFRAAQGLVLIGLGGGLLALALYLGVKK